MTNKEMVESLKSFGVSLVQGKGGLVLATKDSMWVIDSPENLFDTMPYAMLVMVYPEILLIRKGLLDDFLEYRIFSSMFNTSARSWSGGR